MDEYNGHITLTVIFLLEKKYCRQNTRWYQYIKRILSPTVINKYVLTVCTSNYLTGVWRVAKGNLTSSVSQNKSMMLNAIRLHRSIVIRQNLGWRIPTKHLVKYKLACYIFKNLKNIDVKI